MTVSLVEFDGSLDSLYRAIDLCNGFDKLNTNDRILIKPNNCFRHYIMPPYGMVTTTWIIEGIIKLLIEYGCRNISIGEGAIIGIFNELDPYTKHGFKGSGIDKIAATYGVKLVDFNQGPFRELNLGGIKVKVSETALDTDFLVNVPTLKTHFQTRVSLGFKNLKGCLSQESKKKFHRTNRLNNLICLLNEAIKTDLVIVDGIYSLEKGPETLAGTARRKNLIMASTDVFECDTIGATILGINPSEVDYLREYAEKHNRSFDISAIDIKGAHLQSLTENLEWRFDPDQELVTPSCITGLSAPSPGPTLCSSCGATLALSLSILAKDNQGMDFRGAEMIYGLELEPQRDNDKVFLYGDCAIKHNRNLQNAIIIKGCPPSTITTLLTLMNSLLTKPRLLRIMLLRFFKLIGVRFGIYKEVFPGWERYESDDFDPAHFWPRH